MGEMDVAEILGDFAKRIALLESKMTALEKRPKKVALIPEAEEDSEIWPEWYSLLWGIPGMKAAYSVATAWKQDHGISDKVALDNAYALRDWWPRQAPARQKTGDPYATWQNWCRRDQAQAGGPDGTARGNTAPNHAQPRKPIVYDNLSKFEDDGDE